MRKSMLMLGALLLMLSCEKAVTTDHHITAEFPAAESLKEVSVRFAESGTADILIGASEVKGSLDGVTVEPLKNGRLVRWQDLAIFDGSCAEDGLETLLEETFWMEPSLLWIYRLDGGLAGAAFDACGFVHALRARGLSETGTTLFAGSNVYDKISALTAEPLSFTVTIREEAL